jgi:glycosyltransferase involved in cell wall biosynthesis
MSEIPVVVVVYKRVQHAFEVLKALREHNVQNLYIFADGPKGADDVQQVKQTRQLLKRIDWCRPVIVERPENVGLARNIVSAVEYVFEKHDKLILLEDDCVPQKYFFDFMHTCLAKYENNLKVFGISGYTVNIPYEILRVYPYDLYFCPRIGSWGWATWRRAWQYRGKDLLGLIDTAVKSSVDLDQGGTDIPVALENILKGEVKDVWTLNWVLSVYINNGVYIYPTSSHIKNIGMDSSGVHCKTTGKYDSACCQNPPANYPDDVFLDAKIMANFRSYYDVELVRRQRVLLPVATGVKKEPLKVCYINAGDIKGGAHRLGWMLKEGLKQRGFLTKMFVKDKCSGDADVVVITDAVADGGTFYKEKGLLYYDINSTFSLPGRQEFAAADIVHYHNLHGNYFNPFALPALTKLKPSVWTLHDMQALTGHCAYAFDCTRWQSGCGDCPHPDSYPPVKIDRTAQMWQDKKKIYQDCPLELIVPSQWLKEQVEKSILGDKKIHLIYNGIDQRTYRPYPTDTARRMFGIPAEGIVIAFSAHGGLLDKRKGGEFILQAYEYFKSRYKNVYFLCIGGRSASAPKERFVQVDFVLDENRLAQLYNTADVFLFPTLADNCPLVILELMGCAVPVVSFAVGGVPELIEHGKTGFTARYKDSAEFIRMTEYLVGNETKRRELGRAAIERLHSKFTMELMLDRHAALYQRLIEEHKEKTQVQPKNKVSLHIKAAEQPYKYLVSAIVSTYNSERYIRGCLEDLENQTIADKLEIIVVDSGSQQDEQAIVRQFQHRYPNIKYIKTPNRETIYAAWNRAIKAAHGKYISSANTDDRHSPDAFEKMACLLEENPDKVLVYGNYKQAQEIDGRRVVTGEVISGQFSRTRLFAGQCPPGSAPMWRKDLHDAAGYFDDGFFVSGDLEFWFRLTQKYDFLYLPEFLAERLISPQAVSRANEDLLAFENMIIHKCYNYALGTSRTIGAEGISGNAIFADWPEVNLWRHKVRVRLAAEKRSPSECIRTQWDLRKAGQPKLSVVIVAHSNDSALAANLEALLHQSQQDFEVIVVSTGNGLSAIKSLAGHFRNGLCGTELQANFGPSAARNAAIALARAEYIAFLDADVTAERDFVENVTRHFADGGVCGLRGKVLLKTKDSSCCVPDYYDLGEQPVFTACEASSHSAFRKDILTAVGGFDTDLFGYEALELSYRIHKLKNDELDCVKYFPDVVVFHDSECGSERGLEKQLRLEAMSKIARQKWPDIEAYVHLVRSLYPACREAAANDYDGLVSNALYLQQQYPQQALQWAQKAVALVPDGAKGRYLLGSLYVTLGQYDKASGVLEPLAGVLAQHLQLTCPSQSANGRADWENTAQCYLSTCTKLAQCYMKLGSFDRLTDLYARLLSDRRVTIPQPQRAGIEAVLARLQNTAFAGAKAGCQQAQVSSQACDDNVDLTAQPAPDSTAAYLVSAIVSTYNAERFLPGCLDDLLRQTIADRLEIIVVNSGSQQNEEAIIREYQQKYDNIVYIKTEQREGLYKAWNRAIKVARGEFITNANTDDRRRADALEVMAKTLTANPEVALVYGDQICTETENDTFENHHGTEVIRRPDCSRKRLLLGCVVNSQPMWRKRVHEEFGYFDESLVVQGDWDFWIRISSKYNFKHISEVLGLYYYNKEGVEHGRKIHTLYERYLVGKRYGTEYIAVIPFYKGRDLPLVSVIMPAFNAEEYIAEAIESVLIQSYRNFELIVVDDGSTDRTSQVVMSFKDEKIKYLHKPNGGAASARNMGLKHARGRFIVFLDSDDMMQPDYLVSHVRFFSQHPEVDLVYCDHGLIDHQGRPIRIIEQPEYADRRQLIRDMLRCGYPIIQPRGCFKRSAIDRIGCYDEQLPVAEDYDLMRRFIKADLQAGHLKGAFYLRRIHPESLCSMNSLEKAKAHFDVIGRIIDTFSPDELFPDVQWDKIPPGNVRGHADCLVAATLLAIGKNYRTTGQPISAELAVQQARQVLSGCVRVNPAYGYARRLLRDCEVLRRSLELSEASVC